MSKWTQRWHDWRGAVIGTSVVIVIAMSGFLAPWLTPYNPEKTDFSVALKPPSLKHWMGTDSLGRDLFSRTLFGIRIALETALIAIATGLILGTPLGLISGYGSGWSDRILMVFVDSILAFPYILLAIALITVLGAGELAIILAIGIWTAPTYIRLVRGVVLSIRETEYVVAAKSIGCTRGRILLRHIAPQCLPAIIIHTTFQIPRVILLESSLSFLGLGLQPPKASLGGLVEAGRNYLHLAPHISIGPGIVILLIVLGFNMAGDTLRDALDPRRVKH